MHLYFGGSGMPLPFASCENFRELGGYRGLDGKTVKHGLFYRTPALNTLHTEHDQKLFESLGIRTVFDFRSSAERNAAPDPAAVMGTARHVPISAIVDENGNEINFDFSEILRHGQAAIDGMQETLHDNYIRMPFANPAYRALFAALAAQETPLLFHCTAGKDRTGVAAALILKALGVSRADIVTDYMRTNTCRAKGYLQLAEMLKRHLSEEQALELARTTAGVQEENITTTLDEIDTRYPNFAEYLATECAFDATSLAKLRAYALV